MRAGGRVRSVETQEYKTIKEFAYTSNGAKISLSDHDWVEASLKINFWFPAVLFLINKFVLECDCDY